MIARMKARITKIMWRRIVQSSSTNQRRILRNVKKIDGRAPLESNETNGAALTYIRTAAIATQRFFTLDVPPITS